MEATKIRWTDATWNPGTGCTQLSPGCDHCYAKTIAEKFGAPAFPNGFVPTWKPEKVRLPLKWKQPQRVFVNSMSDLFHEAFTAEQIDTAFAVMTEATWHTYQVLTKRPRRMEQYIAGWLARTVRTEVPGHIWLGTSIELDRFVWRAEVLRRIPVPIRFISAEPLLGPLPRLDLTGIAWLIVGGESGLHMRRGNPRWMEMSWARELRDKAQISGTAYFFKQDSGLRTEERPWLVEADGTHQRYEEYPDDSRYRSAAIRQRPGKGQTRPTRRPVSETPAAAAALF